MKLAISSPQPACPQSVGAHIYIYVSLIDLSEGVLRLVLSSGGCVSRSAAPLRLQTFVGRLRTWLGLSRSRLYKMVVRSPFCSETRWYKRTLPQRHLWYPGCILYAFGCILGASGCLLGASWVSPSCFLGASQVTPSLVWCHTCLQQDFLYHPIL